MIRDITCAGLCRSMICPVIPIGSGLFAQRILMALPNRLSLWLSSEWNATCPWHCKAADLCIHCNARGSALFLSTTRRCLLAVCPPAGGISSMLDSIRKSSFGVRSHSIHIATRIVIIPPKTTCIASAILAFAGCPAPCCFLSSLMTCGLAHPYSEHGTGGASSIQFALARTIARRLGQPPTRRQVRLSDHEEV